MRPRQRRRKHPAAGPGRSDTPNTGDDLLSPIDESYPWIEGTERDRVDSESPEDIRNFLDDLLVESPASFGFSAASAFEPLLDDQLTLDAMTSAIEDANDEAASQQVVENARLALSTSSTWYQAPTPSLISPVSVPILSQNPFALAPFPEFADRPNRRALIDHFTNVLSHRIVLREESGNPWQQLVLPLCYRSTTCLNAVYALSSAHLEHAGLRTAERSVSFHGRAIHGLAQLLAQGDRADKHELLATIMLLVYYEVVSLRIASLPLARSPKTGGGKGEKTKPENHLLNDPQLVQNGRSNIVDGHLKGAMTVLNGGADPQDPTGLFLERVRSSSLCHGSPA